MSSWSKLSYFWYFLSMMCIECLHTRQVQNFHLTSKALECGAFTIATHYNISITNSEFHTCFQTWYKRFYMLARKWVFHTTLRRFSHYAYYTDPQKELKDNFQAPILHGSPARSTGPNLVKPGNIREKYILDSSLFLSLRTTWNTPDSLQLSHTIIIKKCSHFKNTMRMKGRRSLQTACVEKPQIDFRRQLHRV